MSSVNMRKIGKKNNDSRTSLMKNSLQNKLSSNKPKDKKDNT